VHKTIEISVVVPFFNAEDTILYCLDGIKNQKLKPLEVILVDNNSSDNSANMVKQFIAQNGIENIHYFFEKKQGPSYARNCGVNHANGDIIAFTDSDCIPDPNWLNGILTAFTDPQIGAVAGRIVGYQGESLLDKFHAMFTLKGLDKNQTFSDFTLVKGGFPTANLAVRKDVFNHIGGFDGFMKTYGEDYDLCARIYHAGFRIQYTFDAVVYHKHRSTLKGTWIQSFGFGIAHALLLKKHFNQMVIIDLPRYQYLSQKWSVHMWIDLAGADKKVAGLILLSIMWWPLSILLISYLLYLFTDMESRLRHNGLKARFLGKWQLVFLLFFKSAAITMGRIIGSLQNKVLCF